MQVKGGAYESTSVPVPEAAQDGGRMRVRGSGRRACYLIDD